MRWIWVILWLAGPATAQSPEEAARAAQAELTAAVVALEAAGSGRDRVTGLTGVVRAFEEALGAVREGLRRAAVRETVLTRQLQAREAEVAELLGALQVLSRARGTTVLLHPSGPAGAARSGMILADITPVIQSEVVLLRADLQEISDIRALQASVSDTLTAGLRSAQEARVALSAAIADRAPLPQRFTQDPVKVALLIAASETLEAFASGLADVQGAIETAATPAASDLRGTLPWPVFAEVLRPSGATDAAGIARPGVVLTTSSEALVTSPTAATIRYRGPLLDYGNVIILEPAADTLIVLAGLKTLYVSVGDVVGGNAPLGLMPQNVGSERTTLYVEVLEAGEAVDPALWFAQR